MRMASTTKSTGSGHLMWPSGLDAQSINNDLFLVIEHALRILSWQENLGKDECPPAWMWHLDWEIEAWFKKVQIERDRKWGNNSSSEPDNDEGDSMWDENILFEEFKNGR